MESSTSGAVIASSGKGKSRFLYELNQLLQKQSRAMCIPITFNGQQNLDLDLDIEAVENLTAQPRQRALVHVVLRLLHATFEIDDLRRFAIDFCNKLKTAATELSTDLLEDVLAECAKHVTVSRTLPSSWTRAAACQSC